VILTTEERFLLGETLFSEKRRERRETEANEIREWRRGGGKADSAAQEILPKAWSILSLVDIDRCLPQEKKRKASDLMSRRVSSSF